MATLEELAPSFRRYLIYEGKAHQTVKTYCAALRGLVGAYRGNAEDISRLDLQAWLHSRSQQVSGTTCNIEWRAIKQFIRWALDEGELTHDPSIRMRQPKVTNVAPQVYSQEEFKQLFEACTKARSRYVQLRDQAMLSVLWECGIRRSELVNITVDNLDLDQQTIRLVVTKSKKPRIVAFSKGTAIVLDRYMRLRAKHVDPSLPYLFLSQRGKLAGNGVYQALREIEKRANFPRTVRPHVFRHSWTNEMLKAGMTPLDVTVLAGWSNMRMLMTYGASAQSDRAVDAAKRFLDR